MITTGETKLLIGGTFGLQRDGLKNENNYSFINFCQQIYVCPRLWKVFSIRHFSIIVNHILMTFNRMLNKLDFLYLK